MYEVELKLRADHESLRERLDDAGASRVEHRRQVDTYYDAPHRSFAETDEALRIRREVDTGGGGTAGGDESTVPERVGAPDAEPPPIGRDGDPDRTKLTYKGPLVDAGSKTRVEHETSVDDGSELVGVLDGLGYEPAATVEKHRRRYELDGYTVTLDAVTGLGAFVEVEAEAEEAGIERVRDGARDLLAELGSDPADQIRTSYLGLLLDAT